MRFQALDGWRGVCALIVAVYHFKIASWLLGSTFLNNSYLCVDFFFVLSGFVLSHSYGAKLARPGQVGPFMLRRLARLWPLHVAVLLALVGLETLKWGAMAAGVPINVPAFTGDTAPWLIVPHVLLIHPLNIYPGVGWNEPSWSIGVEFYTYLVFAGLMLLRWPQAAAVALVGLAFGLVWWSPAGMNSTYDFALFRCFYGFFAGYLAHQLYVRRPEWFSWPTWQAHAWELLAVVGAGLFLLNAQHGQLAFAAPLVFVGVVLVFAGQGGICSKLLLTRPLQALGRWSYSIYMVHAVVLTGLFFVAAAGMKLTTWVSRTSVPNPRALLPHEPALIEITTLGNLWLNNLALVVYVGLVVGLAAVTYRWIEVPGQRWLPLLWQRVVTGRQA